MVAFRSDSGIRALAGDVLASSLPRALADGVRDALDGARMLRSSGIDEASIERIARATGRPRDVVRAAFTHVPDFGMLGVDDVARGRLLVGRALEGLDTAVVVNRYPSTASIAADGYLPTRGMSPATGIEARARRIARIGWERLTGKHGVDELRGRTVYATMQFVPKGESLASWGGRRGAFGAAKFGSQVLELDPSVLATRSTIAARDTGMVPNPGRVAATDRLVDVLVERLARTHGATTDHMLESSPRIGVFGAGTQDALRAQLHRVLHELPDDEAVSAIRRYLASPTLTDIDHFVEVQVRGVREADIVARHVEPLAAAG